MKLPDSAGAPPRRYDVDIASLEIRGVDVRVAGNGAIGDARIFVAGTSRDESFSGGPEGATPAGNSASLRDEQETVAVKCATCPGAEYLARKAAGNRNR